MLKKTYVVDEIPGSISNIYEIKILICRILSEVKHQITKNQLYTAFQLNETVNYFNFCQAMKELESNKHILKKSKKNGEKYLVLTDTGKEAIKSLTSEISKSTIEKHLKSINKIVKEAQENKNKKIYIKNKNNGFSVSLVLEETSSNLLDLEIFCPTKEFAETAKNQMKSKTTEIYKAILAIINNDQESLSKIASTLKNSTKF